MIFYSGNNHSIFFILANRHSELSNIELDTLPQYVVELHQNRHRRHKQGYEAIDFPVIQNIHSHSTLFPQRIICPLTHLPAYVVVPGFVQEHYGKVCVELL